MRRWLGTLSFWTWCAIAVVAPRIALAQVAEAAPPEKTLPLPGEVLRVAGRTAFVIPPAEKVSGKATPWVWYAPTLPNLPGNEERWMFERFTKAGIAIAGIDVGESFGSPEGRQWFSAISSRAVREARLLVQVGVAGTQSRWADDVGLGR